MTRTLIATVIAFSMAVGSAEASDFLKTLGGAIDTMSKQATGSTSGSTSGSGLSQSDITAGLLDALKVGTERVVTSLGAADGYNADPAVHIPLPPQLQQVQGVLKKFGLAALADDVELRLNRAAEAAAPKTKELFLKAIQAMTLDDAMAIYKGPDDAATQYFKKVSSTDLSATIKPVVDQSLADVGALSAYDQLMGQYKNLPFVPDVKANLSDHATGLALKGLFHYLAKEEAAIRQNPAKRTTEILAKVFGGS